MPRCPNGSRKDKKTGKCVKVSTQTKRCPKGTRKNKKTGNCEENTSVKKPKEIKSVEKPKEIKSVEKPKEIKSVEKPKENELELIKKELNDDYESSYKFVRRILYQYMLQTIDNRNDEKNFGGEDEDGTDIYISKREFNDFIDKNIKSIYAITKRVNDIPDDFDLHGSDREVLMIDEISEFYDDIDEFIDNHEQ